MYIPKHFDEPRVEVLHALMQENPLATVITHSSAGLNANHIPLFLAPKPALYGTLRGHVARANAMLADIANGGESLVIFQGADSYITPGWYATKQETGKVVPTWNYAVVHAYGVWHISEDAGWLQAQVEELTARHEATRPSPWQVTDAPEEYIAKNLTAIVGIEMVVTRLLGKWKVSQNQPAQNQAGVIAGLRASSSFGTEHVEGENAQKMASMVELHAKPFKEQ
jgi:transcriptional regulator